MYIYKYIIYNDGILLNKCVFIPVRYRSLGPRESRVRWQNH